MTGIDRAVRVVRRLAALLLAATLLVLLVPSVAAAAPAPAAPRTVAPAVTPAPKPPPSLGVDLTLGGLRIKIDLPLSLTGLLGPGRTPPPSPPPSSGSGGSGGVTTPSPPVGGSDPTPARPGTGPHPAHRPNPVAHHRSAAGNHDADGRQVIAAPRPTATRSRAHHHSVHTKPGRTGSSAAPTSAPVLAQRLLSNPGPGLLLALVIATVLGVALVVRISGRRGEHRG